MEKGPPLNDFYQCDYVMDGTWQAQFSSDRFMGFWSQNPWLCREFRVTSFVFVFWSYSISGGATPGRARSNDLPIALLQW